MDHPDRTVAASSSSRDRHAAPNAVHTEESHKKVVPGGVVTGFVPTHQATLSDVSKKFFPPTYHRSVSVLIVGC